MLLAVVWLAFFSIDSFTQLSGTDVLNDTIGFSGPTLNLRRYVIDIKEHSTLKVTC